MSSQFDVVVIGAGPGGYVAAIRAAQLGASVAVVEKHEVGGTCLNVGCIPTKAWAHSAHVLHTVKTAGDFGVTVGDVGFDFAAASANKQKIVTQLVRGVGGLLKANGVQLIQGTAKFTGPSTLDVDGTPVSFRSAIIATGSFPTRPPVPGIDDPRCVDSTGILELVSQPKRLLVLGGGVIGCEFASIYSHLGTEVSLIEMLPRLVPGEEPESSALLAKELKSRGVAIHLDSRVVRLEAGSGGITAHFTGANGAGTVEADLVLVSTGRAPVVDRLGLEQAGVAFDFRAGIATDDHMRTNVPNIFAIGDCAGKFQLAHTASREGEVAAEVACGHEAHVDYRAVPRVVYTDPEIASVGMTEEQARAEYGDRVKIGNFPFAANSRAAIYHQRSGFVKVIYEDRYGEFLGCSMVGPHVSDMISAGVNAIEAESTIETIAHSIQAHPTLAESLKEAALDAMGQVIHMPPKKRPQPAGAGV